MSDRTSGYFAPYHLSRKTENDDDDDVDDVDNDNDELNEVLHTQVLTWRSPFRTTSSPE